LGPRATGGRVEPARARHDHARVFTIDEIARLYAVGNRYFIDRYEHGIVLYDRDEDGQGIVRG
jgi:hypothetical protein